MGGGGGIGGGGGATGQFRIVTTAWGSTIVPLLWFERFRENVSLGSLTASALIVTSTVFVRSRGAKVSVPDVAA